jgi:hypothetical protein
MFYNHEVKLLTTEPLGTMDLLPWLIWTFLENYMAVIITTNECHYLSCKSKSYRYKLNRISMYFIYLLLQV